MNNSKFFLFLVIPLTLVVVSSCDVSKGQATSYDYKSCSLELKKILTGKLEKAESLCAPIPFTLKKKSFGYSVRGKQSQGHFDIRLNGNPINVFLQAPHVWSDTDTGSILKKLSKKINPRVSFKNSVHRNYLPLDKKNKGVNFDLGKRKNSILVLLSKIFVKDYPYGSVIQIHGFENSKRKTIKGRNADLIISSGSFSPSKRAKTLTRCLKDGHRGLQVYTFPTEVTELGGTKNVLSKLSTAKNKSPFIHIEMSKKYRNLLLSNKEIFGYFSKCIKELSNAQE